MSNDDIIHKLSSRYAWSNDYAQLVELMKDESIVCQALHSKKFDLFDICSTTYQPDQGLLTYVISARGIAYINAANETSFISQCHAYRVMFINPYLPGDY